MKASYFLFKSLAKSLESYLKDLRTTYERAGFTIPLRAYLSLSIFTALLAAIVTFAASFLIHYLVLNFTLTTSLLLSLIPSFIASMLTIAAYIATPFYKSFMWRSIVEPALPHAANFMLAMASAGLPVEAIFERVADVNINPLLTRFARRVVRNVKLLGMDSTAALEDALRISPSASLNKLVRGLLGVILTSGDVRSFLSLEAEGLLRAQRDRLRRLIHSLALLGEVYVAFVIVMPIALVIMGVIISMLGGTILALDPNVFMFFLILVGIPALSLVFLIILDSMLARV
ncbi:MAG: type II secretion system F family protein [Candidatus Nezhaarchaeota archaeon]|nr:type II secretion system F family protein [Candidatus Nezhaarchaeota archaeon]